MMRNLILIHLESLNMLNYRYNRECFPNLCEIEKKSVAFKHYYSSATSTLMVLSDLAYHGSYINETFRYLGWERHSSVEENSLLDDLSDRGYDVTMLHYPSVQSKNENIDLNIFVGKRKYIKNCANNGNFHDEILKVIESPKPFALWLCNFMSHVDFNRNLTPDKSGISRWHAGYEYVDREIGYIFDLLKDRDLFANTSVLFYGDHGDDIYSHGYHGGLTHAVEPYAQLIHTPMFVYDERFQPNVISSVVSTVDLADMINKLLALPEESYDGQQFPVSERKYAFSRNMFAAQRVRRESFEKGYSVTDGKFLLLVNSRGMAMYEIQMDPECQNNLLMFYEMENEKLILKKRVAFWRSHFKNLLDKKAFEEIENKFYELRDCLYKYVVEIYHSSGCEGRLYEMNFDSFAQPVDSFEVNETEIQSKPFDIFQKYFEGKKIVLYGAGNYGDFCYRQIKNICDITAWVDKNYKEYVDKYDFEITAPETMLDRKFDLIYIAIANNRIAQAVFEDLVGWGIDEGLIIF